MVISTTPCSNWHKLTWLSPFIKRLCVGHLCLLAFPQNGQAYRGAGQHTRTYTGYLTATASSGSHYLSPTTTTTIILPLKGPTHIPPAPGPDTPQRKFACTPVPPAAGTLLRSPTSSPHRAWPEPRHKPFEGAPTSQPRLRRPPRLQGSLPKPRAPPPPPPRPSTTLPQRSSFGFRKLTD